MRLVVQSASLRLCRRQRSCLTMIVHGQDFEFGFKSDWLAPSEVVQLHHCGRGSSYDETSCSGWESLGYRRYLVDSCLAIAGVEPRFIPSQLRWPQKHTKHAV